MTKSLTIVLYLLTTLLLLASPALSQPNALVGKHAPAISATSPKGQSLSLDDLRGKVVLVDFWASWCGPCRAENPTLVKAYKDFHNKVSPKGDGFEIFSVSLDVNNDRWSNAISADHLSWPYHVSDFKGWRSAPAAAYGVRQIPSNFVIDKDGKVLAANLRGDELIQFLKAIFD